MPAWTYSNWITIPDLSARLVRLRLHIQEFSDALTAEIAADGKSKSTQAYQQHLELLMKEAKSLEERLPNSGGTGTSTGGRVFSVTQRQP